MESTRPDGPIVARKNATVDPGGYYMTKNGVYGPSSHTITWKVLVDSVKAAGLNNLILTDTIPAGQTYVAGSMKTIRADGAALEDGASKTTAKPKDADGKTVVTIDFTGVAQTWNAAVLAFQYETTVDDNSL